MSNLVAGTLMLFFLLFFLCAGMSGRTPFYFLAHLMGIIEALLQQLWISAKAFSRDYREGFMSTLRDVRAGLGAVKAPTVKVE